MEYLVGRIVAPLLFAAVLSVALMLPLVLLRASQRQKNTESAVFLSKRDKRKGKFVLYLRSFDTDEPSVCARIPLVNRRRFGANW